MFVCLKEWPSLEIDLLYDDNSSLGSEMRASILFKEECQ